MFFSSSICLCGKEGADPQTVCSRFQLLQAGFAGFAGDFWPKLCLCRRCCGRLCHCFVPSACGTEANPSSDPAGGSHPFPNAQTSTASQVPHPKSRTASQARVFGRPSLEPRGCQGSGAGRDPYHAECAKGPFPPGVRASVMGTEMRET